MNDTLDALKTKVAELLRQKDKPAGITPDEPLFTSGLLDSLAATEVMMMLEADYGVDVADDDFDIMRIDTLAGMAELVEEVRAAA